MTRTAEYPALIVAVLTIMSGCGTAPENESGPVSVALDAGKGTDVTLVLPEGVILDSLVTAGERGNVAFLDFNSAGGGGTVSCFMAMDCGSAPGDRADQLEASGIEVSVGAGSVLRYESGDSTALERVWPRGGRELLVLQAVIAGTPESRTLRQVEQMFAEAEVQPWPGLRRVSLSDRSADEIISDMESADVTPPPSVEHRLHLDVIPAFHFLGVSDTIYVDFNPTQSDSQLVFVLPPHTDPGTAGILSLEGSALREGDSVLCIADPSTRRFAGTYRIAFDEFHLRSDTGDQMTLGQVRLSSSFCAESWFYPGSRLPSDYLLSITVPIGFDVYAPLTETGRTQGDSIVTTEYSSADGGVMGPVSWAVGGDFSDSLLAGGSRFIYQPGEEGITDEMSEALLWAGTLAGILWDNLGYEGAGLDFVMVSSLDSHVLLEGYGCLFASPEMLAGLSGHDAWVDTLRAGTQVGAIAVVAKAASAMMQPSTHLPDELRNMIAAWSVYLFCRSTADDTALEGAMILEAFRKYYLYSTETAGGIEYSLADPLLVSSGCAAPVLYGKGPCVLAWFSETLPRFGPALRRALESQRHPGNAWNRLYSGMRLSEGSNSTGEYWDWLLYPGLPQLHVSWSQSRDTLYVLADQYQPGLPFPVTLDEVRATSLDGSVSSVTLEDERAGLDRYFAVLPSAVDTVVSIDLNPAGLVPADFTYERIGPDENRYQLR